MEPERVDYRLIFVGANGNLPLPCFFCDELVARWGRATNIHHVDGNHANNAVENLTVAHRSCHLSYHATGQVHSEQARQKRREANQRRAVCDDCGETFNPIWMTRHVNEGRCITPTLEQIAHGERVREGLREMGLRGRVNGAGVYERTPEIREKIAASIRGTKQTDTHRAAISRGLKRAWDEGRRN